MLAQQHPDYSDTTSLFRMNGTSMSAAVTSGVIALMLDADPELTPDQVKFRLKYAAAPATTTENALQYSLLQQGAGRIWRSRRPFWLLISLRRAPTRGSTSTWTWRIPGKTATVPTRPKIPHWPITFRDRCSAWSVTTAIPISTISPTPTMARRWHLVRRRRDDDLARF